MSDKTIRIFCALLAINSTPYLLVAWLIPFFWPCYVVWTGWFLIAVMDRYTRSLPFWWFSVAINGGLLTFLWEGWGLDSWHPISQLIMATTFSLWLVLILSSHNQRLSQKKPRPENALVNKYGENNRETTK